jgi:uncharacterized protein YdeI (YjbR/CyaY-like superfamily)
MDVRRAKTTDPEEWLERAPEFSRAIAAQVREWFLHWEPDLEEAIKWNILSFSGRKLVCGVSACQRHVGIAFFRGTELPDPAGLFSGGEGNTNIRSVRLKSLEELDVRALRALLHAAVELDADPTMLPAPKVKREPWPVPEFFAQALKKNRRAAAFFESLKPTYQREYLVWVSTAKREETRERRVTETLAALAAGRKWIDRKKV